MSRRLVCVTTAVLTILTFAPARPARAADDPHAGHHHGPAKPGPVPYHDDLGSFHRKITTASPEAQRWFDQGMRLMWAFNLGEAQRSFERALELDPKCASCQWGVALSLGPHINLPALPDRTVAAHAAAQKARAIAQGVTPVEKALIDALVMRYSDPAPTDPTAQFTMDSTYAEAMRAVAKSFPEDNDVVALSVEAMMDLHPWDYWNKDGTPQPWTPEIVSTLEKLMKRDPKHPGVHHYYIHAVEASPNPEKALASADTLVNAMPGAGHMVHMPSHVYDRVGRYDDSYAANARAVESDKLYFGKGGSTGFYNMYAAHNHHFLAWTATKQGRGTLALKHARDAAALISPQMMTEMPGMDLFASATPSVMARFGRWDEILAEPLPSPAFPYLNAMWHYARCRALAAKGRLDEATSELDTVKAIAAAVPPELYEDLNPARSLLAVAVGELSGVIAERRGKIDEAVRLLEQAVRDEDALRYAEPSDWFFPVRVTLGGVLLRNGRAARAEKVILDDLERHPELGWSLYGLTEALRRQKKSSDVAPAQRRLDKAWAAADHKLTPEGL